MIDLPGSVSHSHSHHDDNTNKAQPGAAAAAARIPLSSTTTNHHSTAYHGPSKSAGGGAASAPVELPGSKPAGDTDSDEEIVMSSTAYPGQEWMPSMGMGMGMID